MKKLILLTALFQSPLLFAAGVPVTYNINIDYNNVTDQYENATITGGANSHITTTGRYAIEVTTAKDSIINQTYNQSVGTSGNPEIALQRNQSYLNPIITNEQDSNYSVMFVSELAESNINIFSTKTTTSISANDGCTFVTNKNVANQNVDLKIKTNIPHSCFATTSALGVDGNRIINASDTRMYYIFDLNGAVKNYLRKPTTKNGTYSGTISFDGDSLISSNNNGAKNETYIFNFKINKIPYLKSIYFPSGRNANFTVKQVNQRYMGNSSLPFGINGKFSYNTQLHINLISSNSKNNQLTLKNGTSTIPYKIDLIDLVTGKKEVFDKNNQTKTFRPALPNNFSGDLRFSFDTPVTQTPDGNYTDILTLIASIDIS